MQKSYTRTSHGNSSIESTNQQVHADTKPNGRSYLSLNLKNKIMLQKNQNTIMKTKTMSLFVLAMFGFLNVFMVGCQKDDDVVIPQQELSQKQGLEDVSKVSLQRLAEMQGDETVDPLLYDDVEQRIKSLNAQEYELFIKEWAKVEVEDAINLNIIPKEKKEESFNIILYNLQKRNQESKKMYNESFNKLSDEQQLDIVENVELHGKRQKFITQKSSCPGYYYGYPTTNNGAGLTSCAGYLSATNAVDDDCDYEFRFYPGPITYTPVNLKTKGTTIRANKVLNSGGINGRIASSSEFRILVGYGAVLKQYPNSVFGNPSSFVVEFKFR